MGKWLIIASRRDVVFRSIKVSMVVGTILTIINHSDTILASGIDSHIALKIVLTYCVPYCVATYSSVGALMAQQDNNDN